MPTVPTYKPQVDERALPGARIADNSSAEAFGAGASSTALAKAVGNVGETISDVAQKEKDYIDTVQSSAADTNLAKDQTDIQVKIGQMYGRDANGAAEYATKALKDSIEKNSKGLTGNGLLKFQQAAANRGEGLYGFVEKHTASENYKADVGELTDRAKVLNGRAVLNSNNPVLLNKDLADIHDTVKQLARVHGIPEKLKDGSDNPTYSQLLNGTLSQTHRDVIDAMVNSGNIGGADAYFVANKDRMIANDINSAKDKVEDAKVIILGNQILADGLTKRLPGGGIDQNAMFAQINSLERVDPARKAKLASYVKARVQEENVRFHQQTLDTDKSFQEWAASKRKAGVPLADVVRNIPKQFYRGNFGEYEKQQALYKIYNPTQNVDVGAALALGEKIRNGGGSYQEIDDLRGKISDKMYYGLRKELGVRETKGVAASRNSELVTIKDEITRAYQKARKKDGQELLHQVEQESIGLDGNATRKLYEEKIKDVVTKKGWIWDDTKPQWKIDRDKNKQKVTPGAAAVDSATNNAIATLRANGKSTSPQHVQQFLKKYPTGKIQ